MRVPRTSSPREEPEGSRLPSCAPIFPTLAETGPRTRRSQTPTSAETLTSADMRKPPVGAPSRTGQTADQIPRQAMENPNRILNMDTNADNSNGNQSNTYNLRSLPRINYKV